MNTYQGLVITDGAISYTVFIYRCGDINWAIWPMIGFNAAGHSFANHPHPGHEVACLNSPHSQWYNLVYLISLPNATAAHPPIEPRTYAVN